MDRFKQTKSLDREKAADHQFFSWILKQMILWKRDLHFVHIYLYPVPTFSSTCFVRNLWVIKTHELQLHHQNTKLSVETQPLPFSPNQNFLIFWQPWVCLKWRFPSKTPNLPLHKTPALRTEINKPKKFSFFKFFFSPILFYLYAYLSYPRI